MIDDRPLKADATYADMADTLAQGSVFAPVGVGGPMAFGSAFRRCFWIPPPFSAWCPHYCSHRATVMNFVEDNRWLFLFPFLQPVATRPAAIANWQLSVMSRRRRLATVRYWTTKRP